MEAYGVIINEKNYKEKSTRELENALDMCEMTLETMFSNDLTLMDYHRIDEANRLMPLIKKELEKRKKSV